MGLRGRRWRQPRGEGPSRDGDGDAATETLPGATLFGLFPCR
jgi:hypothetical protein